MLSNEQREFYLENGYLIVENVLSAERLERARDALEERYALEGDQAGSEGTDHQHFVRRLCNLFSKGRVWEEMGVKPIVLDVAKLTIGEDVRWQAMNFHGLCCKPDVGVSQIRTTTVLSSCFCVGQTVL